MEMQNNAMKFNRPVSALAAPPPPLGTNTLNAHLPCSFESWSPGICRNECIFLVCIARREEIILRQLGLAEWLGRQTRDRKVSGLIPDPGSQTVV